MRKRDFFFRFSPLIIGPKPTFIALATSSRNGSSSDTKNNILARIFMSFWTMGFFNIFCRNGIPTKDIFPWCHGLKVVWIYTKSVSAKMIKMGAVWDFAFKKKIGKPVSIPTPVSRVSGSKDSVKNLGVLNVSWRGGARPVPAGVGLVDMFDKKRRVVVSNINRGRANIPPCGFHMILLFFKRCKCKLRL